MGAPTSEVGYTSATTRRGNHEVHKGHVVALEHKTSSYLCVLFTKKDNLSAVTPGLNKLQKQLHAV
jgi:hypothetical protein